MEDLLMVSFAENYEDDPSAICITRKTGDHIEVLKMELGEQADILHRLLTEQMTKAEIKGGLQTMIDDMWKRKKPGSPKTSPVCADILDILQEGEKE